MGLLFVPVNVAGTAPLRRDQIGTATGTLNLMRNVGGSVGIALVTTLLARKSQVHQNMLGQHLTPGSPILLHWMHGLHAYLAVQNPAFGHGMGPALASLYRMLQQQAALLAFMDTFHTLLMIALGSIALVFLLRRVRVKSAIISH
jgi:DHA2 family multidrug resistance protein